MIVIRTCTYEENPKLAGRSMIRKIFTYGEVCAQADAFLKTIFLERIGCNAFEAAENVFNYSYIGRNAEEIPLDTRLVVIPQINSNEELNITLYGLFEERLTPIWSVDYQFEMDSVWDISKKMALAVHEGRFIDG